MSENDEAEESPSQAVGCLIKLVSHGVVLIAGLALGYLIPVILEQYENPEIMASPEAESSRAELIAKLEAQEKAYQDLLEQTSKLDTEQKTQLSTASAKVVDLEGKVAAAEKELEISKAKEKKSAGKSAARKKELDEKEAELAALKEQLATAIAEKEQLTAALEVSRQETATARQETTVARGETATARADEAWSKFRGDAIVKVCKKGTEKKMDNCRNEATDAVDLLASRFKGCVLSRQATPRLVEVVDKRSVSLPSFSQWLDQDSDFTRDKFYVTFCDPSLPEAPADEEEPL